jgi:hypothetical protein
VRNKRENKLNFERYLRCISRLRRYSGLEESPSWQGSTTVDYSKKIRDRNITRNSLAKRSSRIWRFDTALKKEGIQQGWPAR